MGMDCRKTESVIVGIVLLFGLIGVLMNVTSANLAGMAHGRMQPSPELEVVPSKAYPGDEVTVVGEYFSKMNHWPIKPPYPSYTITLDDKEIHEFERPVDGEFRESIRVPDVEPGKHEIGLKEYPEVEFNIEVVEYPEEWERLFGGKQIDNGHSILNLDDGYVLVGRTYSYGSGSQDGWMIKTDEYGNEVWSKTYGGEEEDVLYDVLETKDGFFLLGRTENWGSGDFDMWLIRIDEEGNEVWSKTYGGELWELGHSIVEDQSGGYILAGETTSYGSGGQDAYIVRIDEEGNEVWSKTYGGYSYDSVRKILRVEGGYILIGRTWKLKYQSDFWMFKIDEDGDMIWNKTYGGKEWDGAYDVSMAEDGYVLIGRTDSYGRSPPDVWVIKTDLDGEMLWNETYSRYGFDKPTSIKQTPEGYVYLSYTMDGQYGKSDILAQAIDEEGGILWERLFGGGGIEVSNEILPLGEGEYVSLGATDSYGSGMSDVWMIKFIQ